MCKSSPNNLVRKSINAKLISKSPITDQILDAMPYPVLMLDGDNKILFANLASEGFFHASVSFLQGCRFEEFIPYSSPALDMLVRVRVRQAEIREYKVDLSSPKTGQEAIVDILATPIPEITGNVVVIFQKRAMADKIDRQLTHRGAARTVTGLASMLAHEIKNPLSGIRGAAQLLASNVEPEDRSLTQLITDETDRIVGLVDEMEVFSDDRTPERVPINIHSVLDHVKALAINGFGKNVRFIENYDPSLPPVYANRDQLIQVLINLVKNSCEALDNIDKPIITLTTAFRPGIKLSSPGSPERVSLPLEFSISDNGCGISDALIPHVFDPFVTTKIKGTGLGLALVSKIVDDHGGVIEIEHNTSRFSEAPGTKVRILMPLWQGIDEPSVDGDSDTRLRKSETRGFSNGW
ncbi:MAG: two-component sensor histidine kinase [Hyphomicrobiales bacterium]|nr:two-component sensor histidine kinase [Hyphomicrobiales bacterium]